MKTQKSDHMIFELVKIHGVIVCLDHEKLDWLRGIQVVTKEA